MRYVWTVAGDDPDWNALKRHGITGCFAPLWDTLTTREYLLDFVTRGYDPGIYLGHNWFPGDDPDELARRVDAEYKRVLVPKLRVMFNLEQHDPVFILACLTEWRRLQPKVNTSWSPEGMQGGWMGVDFVQGILACKVRVVPQAFTGSMQRFESDAILRDLTKRGFPEHIVSVFYDAAQLGLNWDGFCFTAGRLP